MTCKYAVLENNVVVALMDLEEQEVAEASLKHQLLIDIDTTSPQPQVGWVLVGNKLAPSSPMPIEQIIQAKIKKAREFGTKLVGDAVDRIGAKNVLSGKTEAQVLEVAAMLQPIKQLLEGGALATARTQLGLVRSMVDTGLQGEIDWAAAQITAYLGY